MVLGFAFVRAGHVWDFPPLDYPPTPLDGTCSTGILMSSGYTCLVLEHSGCSSICFAPSQSLRNRGLRHAKSHCPSIWKRVQWTCRKGRASTANRSEKSSRGRGAKRAALYDAMTNYSEHFRPLLRAELDAEQSEIRVRRDDALPRSERVIRGDALFGLVATKQRRIFSNEVYALSLRCDDDIILANESFGKGDLVDVSFDVDTCPEVLQGTILSRSRRRLLVTFTTGSEADRRMSDFANNESVLKVERGTNTLAFERAMTALDIFVERGPGTSEVTRLIVMTLAEGTVPRQSASIVAHEPFDMFSYVSRNKDGNPIDRWNSLAREGIGKFNRTEFNRLLQSLPRRLNGSQRAAIRNALCQRLTLLQGPPGTGKTLTAAYVIVSALQLGLGPVLGCAASNVATDNLMRKVRAIASNGATAKIVRVGRVSSVGEDLWENSLDGLLERNRTVQRARDEFERGLIRFSELNAVQKEVALNILKNADVVFSTCVGCGIEELGILNFGMVLVDEATQATETDTLIGLSSGKTIAPQVVLVGDHHQLPPTTLGDVKKKINTTGLETSLFLRLWMSGVQCELLKIQYRMHPKISRFPSLHFYMNRVKDGVLEEDLPLRCNIVSSLTGESSLNHVHSEGRVVFCDVEEGVEEMDGSSYYNKRETEVVLRIIADAINTDSLGRDEVDGWKAQDVGVISPYSAQVKTIRVALSKREGCQEVEVNTVDGFQGREKDVIILCAVRSNNENRVGFLSDWRRLNVAITRARCALIVVANGKTMLGDKHWAAWLKWVKRNGLTISERDGNFVTVKRTPA